MPSIEVLNSLDKTSLLKIARQEGLSAEEDDSKKKLSELISEEVENSGLKVVVNELKRADLEKLVEPLKLEIPKNSTKAVYGRRFIQSIDEMGLESFLSKHMDAPRLKMLISAATAEEEDEISGDK